MENLVHAIEVVNNPQQYDLQQIQEAKEYCNDFVQLNFMQWKDFFAYFQNQQNSELVRFWVLNALIEIVQKRHDKMSPNDKTEFYEIAMHLCLESPGSVFCQKYFASKYSQLLANIFSYFCEVKSIRSMFDDIVTNLILPSQSSEHQTLPNGQTLHFMFSQLFLDTLQELYYIIKRMKAFNIEMAFRIKGAYKEMNQNSIQFLIFLLSDQHTPLEIKSKIINLINKMIAELDYNFDQCKELLPLSLDLLQIQDNEVIINNLKFLRNFFRGPVEFSQQRIIVQKIFENIEIWGGSQDMLLFYTISKVFLKIINAWQHYLIPPTSSKNHNPYKYRGTGMITDYQDQDNDNEDEDFNEEDEIRNYMMSKQRKSVQQSQNEQTKLQQEWENDQEKQLLKQEVMDTFQRIFQIGRNLVEIDNIKIQIIIVEMYNGFLYLTLRANNKDLFKDQILSIIQMCIEKLRFPDWYDISKKAAESQDEETFNELRENLLSFLGTVLYDPQYLKVIENDLDHRIQSVANSGTDSFDPRELEIIFSLINTFVNKTRSASNQPNMLQKYQFLLFSENLIEINCSIFADQILDIYQNLNIQELQQDHVRVILNFIFSKNGILSKNQILQAQASTIFLKEFRTSHQSIIVPFIRHLLQLIRDNIIAKIDVVSTGKDKISSHIFTVLGSLLCETSIPLEERVEIATHNLYAIYQSLKNSRSDKIKQRFLVQVISYVIKGFRQTIEEELKQIFLMMYDSLLQDVVSQTFDDNTNQAILELGSERIPLFKDANFQLLKKYLLPILTTCSHKTILSYFKSFNSFNLSVDAQIRVMEFAFQEYYTMTQYIANDLQIVTAIKTTDDSDKSSIQEELLKILKEATLIDWTFLFSKNEETFLEVMQILNEVYKQSFCLRVKYEALHIIVNILTQLFGYKDEEFLNSQNHQRQRLNYNSIANQVQLSEQTVEQVKLLLEYAAINYQTAVVKQNQDLNDKIFGKIVILQDLALKHLDEGFRERMRSQQKNDIKILYGTVLENFRILDAYQKNKYSKSDMIKQFVKCMNSHLEEKLLRSLDD
eukprot:403370306